MLPRYGKREVKPIGICKIRDAACAGENAGFTGGKGFLHYILRAMKTKSEDSVG
jgi:hypothetical protein